MEIQPLDGSDPVGQVRAIEHELGKFDAGLLDKPRWLLINKADLMDPGEARAEAERIVEELGWQQPWFLVSGIAHEGTREVMLKVQAELDRLDELARETDDAG